MIFKARLVQDAEERDYLLRRALEEENAALAAVTLKARWVHEELSILYRARAHALGSSADRPQTDLWPPENAAA